MRYKYTPTGQLRHAKYLTYEEELFYDKAGNRTRRIVAGSEELYSYDARNRLTQFTKDGQATAFEWDNAGNLLKDDKAAYSYDEFNRTTKVETFDGNTQVNRYDAEGLRYEMEENGQLVQFIFNTEREVVAEKENEWAIYIRGSEILASSNDHARTYYHYATDEMGSITHIVDDRNILNEYEYDVWGNVVKQKETIPNRFKFNGQQLDPITQQYYLRARFYNPIISRFTQEDTYRGDGLNLYAYCKNNPVKYVDPTGNACQSGGSALKKAQGNNGKQLFNKNNNNIPQELLNTKPNKSPSLKKWFNKGGSVSIDDSGTWIFTDWEGNSVPYPNGYPDFKAGGYVTQEVTIPNGFKGRQNDANYVNSVIDRIPKTVLHHKEDGFTIQEVIKDIHSTFTHSGGISLMGKK